MTLRESLNILSNNGYIVESKNDIAYSKALYKFVESELTPKIFDHIDEIVQQMKDTHKNVKFKLDMNSLFSDLNVDIPKKVQLNIICSMRGRGQAECSVDTWSNTDPDHLILIEFRYENQFFESEFLHDKNEFIRLTMHELRHAIDEVISDIVHHTPSFLTRGIYDIHDSAKSRKRSKDMYSKHNWKLTDQSAKMRKEVSDAEKAAAFDDAKSISLADWNKPTEISARVAEMYNSVKRLHDELGRDITFDDLKNSEDKHIKSQMERLTFNTVGENKRRILKRLYSLIDDINNE